MRPGTAPTPASPTAAADKSAPHSPAAASAASALLTLNAPGSRTCASTAAPAPRTPKRDPESVAVTSTARQSAAASRPKVVVGIAGAAARRATAGSSALTRPRRARAAVNRSALAAKYSSRSAWKSRWSRPKLVNTARSNTTPSTRPITSAWLETSIAQACTPASRITANSACRSGASGVVRLLATGRPSMRVPTVPTTAVRSPAPASAADSRCVVVVLPEVPVTPISVRSRAGWPYTSAATDPSTGRGAGTTSTGSPVRIDSDSPSGSVSTATAPASRAAAA